MGEFCATRDSSGYCDWPRSNAKKRGAVKDTSFPAFISRSGAAQRGAACSVALSMTNSTVYLRPVGPYLYYHSALQRQKAVSAYITSKHNTAFWVDRALL